MRYGIKASKLFLKDRIVVNSVLIVNNDKIEKVVSDYKKENLDKVYDLGQNQILPGLIDTHTHGCNGYDTMDANFKALNEMSKYHASRGITAFLSTTVTDDMDKIKNALKNVSDSMEKVEGAEILGAYVEGPYITSEHKGAHPENFIRAVNLDELKELIKVSNNVIKVITLAPEKENALDFIELCKNNKIKVSLGHTSATYEETKKAFNKGASIVVHVFNGMRGLHHREPGIVGAALTDNNVFSELICDLVHQHPATVELLLRCRPKEKIVLISDSIQAAGLKDGEYKLGALKVIVKDSVARVESGSLAGSTVNILKSVRILINKFNVNAVDAVNMASLNPSKEIGMNNQIGSIEEGKKANLTIVDKEFKAVMTIVNGKIVYR